MADSASHDPPKKRRAVKRRKPTQLESVAEIRRALGVKRVVVKRQAASERKTAPKPDAETTRFRPVHRPPMALLCILDDGYEEGQWLRIRSDRVLIGRSEGDVLIPHDTLLSGKHAELARRLEEGRYRWYLTDLDSKNGTYVRVGKALLNHNQELLIGSHRYRFDAAPQSTDGAVSGNNPPKATHGWQKVAFTQPTPALVQLTSKGDGRRYLLPQTENWVGRGSSCAVVISDDPLLSSEHVRFARDFKGRWHCRNGDSLNGTWLRIDCMMLDNGCQFQLGEQRFVFKVR